MTHGIFRDLAPFKGDLFTSMCRFLEFYSNLWGGWSIYSECMGLSWTVNKMCVCVRVCQRVGGGII